MIAILCMLVSACPVSAEVLQWEGWAFETRNVHASVVMLKGESVLKLERDLKAVPFDAQR
jgi:aminoglycoside phosphotransferase family enzyme